MYSMFQVEEQPPVEKQAPKPRPQATSTKAEPIPKLRPVSRPSSAASSKKVERPKSALLPPSGALKPLQPLAETRKQSKTSDSSPVVTGYEYVTGPPREADGSGAIAEDLYSVPVKDTSSKSSNENTNESVEKPTSPFTDAIQEDLYQVPGQVTRHNSFNLSKMK